MARHTTTVWGLAILAMIVGIVPMLPAYAHGGGTPRLTNVPVGPYNLYAWSDPEPWRVGEVHLSLAVTMINPDSSSSQVEIPVTDVEITVTYTPMNDNAVDTALDPIVVKAVRQAFLSDFYYEADPTLTRAGDWMITVAVAGPEGSGSTDFPMETLPERALNWNLVGTALGILVVGLALLAIWSRSQQPAPAAQRPQRGSRSAQAPSSKRVVRKEV